MEDRIQESKNEIVENCNHKIQKLTEQKELLINKNEQLKTQLIEMES